MTDLVFFYGTLMTPFNRAGRLRVDQHLVYTGRGTIAGALFDLGIYPAAVRASDARVWGEMLAEGADTVQSGHYDLAGSYPMLTDGLMRYATRRREER